MSDRSDNLSLPYIQPSQAQKHVTHNEALRQLDAVVQLAVSSASVTTPPALPEPGQRYIVPAGASGDWAGQEGALAVFEETGWAFYAPNPGWIAWVEDSARQEVFDGSDWGPGIAALQDLTHLGVNTSADDMNRLAVASQATLLTHAGAGHQLKLNKAGASDTASLLFQTGWSGRAEMGTPGGDDFEIKVSGDGAAFNTALRAEATTGAVSFPSGVTGLVPDAFGGGDLANTAYVASRGLDLVTNGTGLLGNSYNFPTQFTFDPVVSPNLPGSFRYEGHYSATLITDEALAVDPNRCYRMGCYLRQQGLAGDWSGYTYGERHGQYLGIMCLDSDGLAIQAMHHMRHKQAGVDSRTTLAAPLAPGDTAVHLSDSTGWNDSYSETYRRGITIFGYRNSAGYLYEDYTRLAAFDLFELTGVDKTNHIITLKAPLPASLGNPDDAGGVWPVGTVIANSSSGSAYKYALLEKTYAPEVDRWYAAQNYIGGVDRSGQNVKNNFAPGTAFARLFWLANYTNRVGGYAGHPDTGASHAIWFAGLSVRPDDLCHAAPVTSGELAGSWTLHAPQGDVSTGEISLVPAALSLAPL
ncbi:DUF2793 domain-containing protein [Roseovarius nubinhibens]|uniref:DUF2793 domain-containing protein n=1 Tax=Roseovarius nubinhibens (strain ATCC BAA-591 / DSM 15170 / ISM) TaxID=89187 RepID=A3SL73_ROSNI|nr:DUF2793 domain-containing protein [Roseovarius nubinhibens]EAP78104.1 hypothetical protein ISM_07405 [Roseovarius nubinhibens ISM]